MIVEDAFPEMGQREEFRRTMVKQAIKDLCQKVPSNDNFPAAYDRAQTEETFVQRLGEVVCTFPNSLF